MLLGSFAAYLYMKYMYIYIYMYSERDFCPSAHEYVARIVYRAHAYMYRSRLFTGEALHWFSDAYQGSLFRSGCLTGLEEHSSISRRSAFLWNLPFLLRRIQLFLIKTGNSRACFARKLPWEHLQLESLSGLEASLLNVSKFYPFTHRPL